MSVHVLKKQQFIKASIENVWGFFCSTDSIAALTPSYVNVKTTSVEEPEIYTGQIISYKMSPIKGLPIPLKWTTEIQEVVKYERFTDNQQKGPYKLWRHEHVFEQKDGGVLISDTVHYELPLYFLGNIAHALFIRKQLHGIFEYRRIKVDALFNK